MSKIVYKEQSKFPAMMKIFQCLQQRLEISGTVRWFLQMLTDQTKKLARMIPFLKTQSLMQISCPKKTQTLLNLLTESQDEIITVKIPELKEDKPSSRNKQYLDVAQGTSEWRAARVRVITVSKLPSLLGFNGNKDSDSFLSLIHI